MLHLRVLANTRDILQHMLKNRVQPETLELILEIVQTILGHFIELVKVQEAEISEHIPLIYDNFDNIIQLLSLHFGVNVVEKASACLIQLLYIFAHRFEKFKFNEKQIYFVESHFPFLMSAIKSEKHSIQKNVLKCVKWALIQEEEYKIVLSAD